MSYFLENKIALVTGAASGLGRATALLFAKEGAHLFLSDVDAKGGAETVDLIVAGGGKAEFEEVDVANGAQVEAMVETCVRRFGKLNCAVNNAAVEGERRLTAEYGEAEWDRVVDINLKGVFLCLKYEIPEIIKAGGGGIVNVGSTASLGGVGRMPAYVAAKHGLLGLTRTCAIDHGDQNIRVNAIFPGSFRTPLSERLFGKAELEDAMKAVTPLRRVGGVEEIAETIVWLCSDRASFVTGAGLSVDGGKRAA